MTAVLLADEDDDRRPVGPRCGDGADRVTDPGSGVQVHYSWLPTRQRVPHGCRDHDRLVQAQHIIDGRRGVT